MPGTSNQQKCVRYCVLAAIQSNAMGKINSYNDGGVATIDSSCCWEHWNEPRRFVVEPPVRRLRQPRTIITVSDVDNRLIEQTMVEPEGEDLDEEEEEEQGTAIPEDRLEYRAEGNANIVMAVRGSRYVLRLRKFDVARSEGKVNNEPALGTLTQVPVTSPTSSAPAIILPSSAVVPTIPEFQRRT